MGDFGAGQFLLQHYFLNGQRHGRNRIRMLGILKRKFIVLAVVRLIGFIMKAKKLQKSQILNQLLMFVEVLQKHRQTQQLMKLRVRVDV